MASLLLIAYFGVLALLASLGLHRLLLAGVALRERPRGANPPPPEVWPRVVVQLPLYDEAFVAERVLRAAAALAYPREALELQVLDDSTDHTRRIVDRVAAELAAAGIPITVLRRGERVGYKAGALAHGLAQSRAELVAIFDADFVPPPDFLLRTVPALLSAPDLGLVQARWGHQNRDVSWLTRAQAIFLDGHFAVEHLARDRLGHFFNFNGTAGLWRRAAIEEAGGWSSATITEDLDLSYRAQLAGWRFGYLDEVVAPAELPETWGAFRSQQARWVRGSVQTARLHVGRVLGARDVPRGARFDAALHLGQNFAYLFTAILALLLPAAVVVRDQLGWRVPGGQALASALDLGMLGAGTLAVALFYLLAAARTGAGALARVPDVLFALCVGAGMSFSNAREVLAGLRPRRAEFVRTPKRGAASAQEAARAYGPRGALPLVRLELALAAVYAAALGYAFDAGLWGAMPFLALYLVGFAAVGAGSAREQWLASRAQAEAPASGEPAGGPSTPARSG